MMFLLPQGMQQTSTQPRHEGIDAFRLLAFLAVVCIHVLSVLPVSLPTAMVSSVFRFSVPFFFMASGFFLKELPARDGILRVVKRLAPVYIFWVIVYLLLSPADDSTVGLKGIVLLAYAGGPGYHLWFLPALGMSVALLYVLRRARARNIAFVGVALFAFSLAFGAYSSVVGLPDVTSLNRSGPFAGFFFVALGYLFASKNIRFPLKVCFFLIILGLFVQLAEVWALSYYQSVNASHDFYLGTAPLACGAFLLSLHNPSGVVSRLAGFGYLTLGMYCVHVLFLNEFRSLEPLIAQIPVVVGLSFIAVIVMARVPFLKRFIN